MACGGRGFPRELLEDMERVGSKASAQSHQLHEGNFFIGTPFIEHARDSMTRAVEKLDLGIKTTDILRLVTCTKVIPYFWLETTLCAEDSQPFYVCQLVVPGQGCLYYLSVRYTLRISEEETVVLFTLSFILCLLVCLSLCLCTSCVPVAPRGQKRASDPTELNL